jgi:hypothetical protein
MLPDRQARDQVIGALRSLVAGQLTQDEFESRVPSKSSDPAIKALLSDNAWRLYGDAPRREQPLADRDRAVVSRWQLFLKTDKAYEWPTPTLRQRVALALMAVLTLGISAKLVRRSFKRAGDLKVWPFLRRADYDAAMKSPAYL